MAENSTSRRGEALQHPATIAGVILALAIQFGSVIWFAASLSSRVDKVEASETTFQQRYEREVIPRADLTERLDRIEQLLDRITDRLIREPNTAK